MASSSKAASDLNPRTTHYEFLGPPGAFAITIGVPTMTYLLYYGCSEETGGCPPPIDFGVILDTVSNPEFWKGLWDTQAVLAYLGWYAFTVVAWLILPGDWIEGTEMRNGQKKKYKINGNAADTVAWRSSCERSNENIESSRMRQAASTSLCKSL